MTPKADRVIIASAALIFTAIVAAILYSQHNQTQAYTGPCTPEHPCVDSSTATAHKDTAYADTAKAIPADTVYPDDSQEKSIEAQNTTDNPNPCGAVADPGYGCGGIAEQTSPAQLTAQKRTRALERVLERQHEIDAITARATADAQHAREMEAIGNAPVYTSSGSADKRAQESGSDRAYYNY